MKELVCVLVPILNPMPSTFEKRMLDHCVKALNKYSLIFVMSEDADDSVLKKEYPHADVVTFPARYFVSREALPPLYLMEAFYERFSWSEFLLIHELNSWIVKDELYYWCKQGYDYLRADVENRIGTFLTRISGFRQDQKKEMDRDFGENHLFLCHIERMLKSLNGKKKEAYAYRHNMDLANKDALFWELEANRFLPTLRRPTRIVQKRFAKNISASLPDFTQDRESWPFAVTGVSESQILDLPFFE